MNNWNQRPKTSYEQFNEDLQRGLNGCGALLVVIAIVGGIVLAAYLTFNSIRESVATRGMDYEVLATDSYYEPNIEDPNSALVAVGVVANENTSEATMRKTVEWMRGEGPLEENEDGIEYAVDDYDMYDFSITEFYEDQDAVEAGDIEAVVLHFDSQKGIDYFDNPDYELYGGEEEDGVYVLTGEDLEGYPPVGEST